MYQKFATMSEGVITILVVKGGEPLPKEDTIATPSFGLNYTLGGGLWTSRYHVLWGEPKGGKSTLALYTAAEAQKQGYEAHLIDTEGSLTDSWQLKCGIDIGKRVAVKSCIMEEILNYLREELRHPGKKFFLIDSVNPIIPESEYTPDADKKAQRMGMGASSQKMFIQRINDWVIQDVDICVMFIVQMSMGNSGQMWLPKANMGNYMEHSASNVIKVRPSGNRSVNSYDEDGRLLRRKIEWTIQKSKQGATEGITGHYYFNPGDASIDWKDEVLDLAVKNEILKKGGAWYTIGDQKLQGADNVKDFLDKENMWTEIKTRLLANGMTFDTEDGGYLSNTTGATN